MKGNFTSLWQVVLDYIFPRSCVGCHEEGAWLCSDCREGFPLLAASAAERLERGELDELLIAADYGLPQVEELIRLLKYQYAEEVAQIIGALMLEAFPRPHAASSAILIPVPLHRRRQADRGFNQALLLARVIGEAWGIPISQNLQRVRATPQQARLKREQRQSNVAQAFAVQDATQIFGRTIYLVDDVHTTGATLSVCASLLRAGGAVRVIGLCFAHNFS